MNSVSALIHCQLIYWMPFLPLPWAACILVIIDSSCLKNRKET